MPAIPCPRHLRMLKTERAQGERRGGSCVAAIRSADSRLVRYMACSCRRGPHGVVERRSPHRAKKSVLEECRLAAQEPRRGQKPAAGRSLIDKHGDIGVLRRLTSASMGAKIQRRHPRESTQVGFDGALSLSMDSARSWLRVSITNLIEAGQGRHRGNLRHSTSRPRFITEKSTPRLSALDLRARSESMGVSEALEFHVPEGPALGGSLQDPAARRGRCGGFEPTRRRAQNGRRRARTPSALCRRLSRRNQVRPGRDHAALAQRPRKTAHGGASGGRFLNAASGGRRAAGRRPAIAAFPGRAFR